MVIFLSPGNPEEEHRTDDEDEIKRMFLKPNLQML